MGKILMLKQPFNKDDAMTWAGFMCLRTRTNDDNLFSEGDINILFA